MRLFLLGSAIALLPISVAAQPSLVQDAQLFGAREAIQSMDISPDGKSLVAIVAGPGRTQLLQTMNAATQEATTILGAKGDPESIYACEFASNTQLVCSYGGYTRFEDKIIGFSRVATLGTDGKNIKPLGQRSHAVDAGLRQFDGQILDWMPDQQGSVLMARNYVPESDTTGSRIADEREGLGST